MGDETNTSSPLYHPATSPAFDARLAALSDEVARKRTRDPNQPNVKWVRLSSNARKDRLAQWAATAPGSPERTALEEAWAKEDQDDEDAKNAAAKAEEDRARRVVEARQRLRGG